MNKKAIVLGAGGFIGNHLVNRLKDEGYYVVGADLKEPPYSQTRADVFIVADLRDKFAVDYLIDGQDEVYQLAAEMGGAGYIFTGENDYNIMHNSALINLNVSQRCVETGVGKVFYSSSACVYPKHNQMSETDPISNEDSAYPADPDSNYGWEKLFSENLYLSAHKNYGLNVRIARFHNTFGELGTYDGGREKAPAALCRKVALADKEIELWGDGEQTRTFTHVSECVEGIRRLMESDFTGPVNIGSAQMVSMNEVAEMIMKIAGKKLKIKHIDGPVGIRGRSCDQTLCKEKLDWAPYKPLVKGLESTYLWIQKELQR